MEQPCGHWLRRTSGEHKTKLKCRRDKSPQLLFVGDGPHCLHGDVGLRPASYI